MVPGTTDLGTHQPQDSLIPVAVGEVIVGVVPHKTPIRWRVVLVS